MDNLPPQRSTPVPWSRWLVMLLLLPLWPILFVLQPLLRSRTLCRLRGHPPNWLVRSIGAKDELLGGATRCICGHRQEP
jgi:hypothetical protein